MPQSTPGPAPGRQSITGAASPGRFVSTSLLQRDDEDPAVWQPAVPRLRMFSPAIPRPSSAAPSSPTHTTTVIVSQPQGRLSPRPASATCGKLAIPGDQDRLVTPAITSPGAGPNTPTPTRASQILSKAHALQARTSAYGPQGLVFGAPSAAAAAAAATTAPLVLCDSPPGSPLLVVRSATRNPRPPSLITPAGGAAAATSAGGAAAVTSPSGGSGGASSPGSIPAGTGRCRRSSLPEPLLPPCSSSPSGAVHLSPPSAARQAAGTVSSSGAVDGSAAGSAGAGASCSGDAGAGAAAPSVGPSQPVGRIRGLKATISGTDDCVSRHVRSRSVSPHPTGPRRPQESSRGETSSGIATDSGESSASEEIAGRRDRSGTAAHGGGGGGGGSGVGAGGAGREDSGGGEGSGGDPGSGGDNDGSGGDSAPPSRNASAVDGGSDRPLSVPSPSPSPSPVIWPWPQDGSRRSSQAGSSLFAPPTTSSFLHSHLHSHPHLLNHPNQHNGHPTHLSLVFDRRTTTLGGSGGGLSGGLVTRGSYSPGRPASSAAQFGGMNPRAVSFRSRPRSCSGGGSGGGAGGRPTSGVGPRSPSGTGPGASPAAAAAAAAGGGPGSAVAAAAAATPATAMYEILPDYNPRAAAAGMPLGGRLARAIAGILPSGNPGTFNLDLEERIQKVLHETPVKTPPPKTTVAPPNPTVLKMLHDRHEAEAQRNVVDTAFSSGNPAVWMHQILRAESGAAVPPWASQGAGQGSGVGPLSLAHLQQQQQQLGGGPSLSPRQGRNSPRQGRNSPRQPRPSSRQQPLGLPLSFQQQRSPSQLLLLPQNSNQHSSRRGSVAAVAGGGGGGAAAAASHGGGGAGASPQRLTSGLGAGVPRHTSAETLHLQSVSYLASKEACRTLAADSKPAVSINLREVVLEGRPANGGISSLWPGAGPGAALGLRR